MSAFGTERIFLNVERSLGGRRWVHALDPRSEALATQMSQALGLPDIVSRVLAARGVAPDQAERFLAPTIRDLMPDPSTLTDMDVAAARIADAIARKERIAIFGDYDVDGAASAALLHRYLLRFGIHAPIRIPDRLTEGYGPNPAALTALADAGATLIVTVDCGTTSPEAIAALRQSPGFANDARLDPHGVLKCADRVAPTISRLIDELTVRHREIDIGILIVEDLVDLPNVEGDALRFTEKLLRARDRLLELLERRVRQAGEVARLVYQHLRFVLQRLNLVVDLLERARRGQKIFGVVSGIEHDPAKAEELRMSWRRNDGRECEWGCKSERDGAGADEPARGIAGH